MSSHLANGVSFPLDFTQTKTFKNLSHFTFNALPPSKLVDFGFCLGSPRRSLACKILKRHIYLYSKFTHSTSSMLIHAFHAKSLLNLTLLYKFILPFLPPSLWVDDQFPSLTVELLFFHTFFSWSTSFAARILESQLSTNASLVRRLIRSPSLGFKGAEVCFQSVDNFHTGFQEGKWLYGDNEATDKELDSLHACREWLETQKVLLKTI